MNKNFKVNNMEIYPEGYIYMIENNFDSKIYIGYTTIPVEEKFIQHKTSTNNKMPFHVFMKTHGPENFSVKCLHTATNVSICDLQILERSFIKDLNELNQNQLIPDDLKKSREKIFEYEYPEITLEYILEITKDYDKILQPNDFIKFIFPDDVNVGKIIDGFKSSGKVTKQILDWLGCEKSSFLKRLASHNIEFKLIDDDIVMDFQDFKTISICLKTKRSNDIRNYFLSIEKLFNIYQEYVLYCEEFGLRERNMIDDLITELKEYKERTEKTQEEYERRSKDERRRLESKYNKILKNGEQMLEYAEKAEEDRIQTMNDMNVVRNVISPQPNRTKLNKLGIVKMSPRYVWAEGDPEYFKHINAVVVRTQTSGFNSRLTKIRNAGNGTNRRATVLFEVEMADAINLFAKLREMYSNVFRFEPPFGIRYRRDEDLVGAVRRICGMDV
ncbi:126L [Cherax quadricarinatus iridovirus]|uniref:Group I intron endonuclease n=1 Tax=Shrimp hemocyte iridescent virus TaxID=2039780 RepID=A0A291B0M1_9VIRU|nr:126L [Cherax quadricarinatus iridovirus]YP_010084782.1 group I intron endonuclease [Shrimp hemocyte iridescent virus]UPA43433.1 group I intron endonuclease [Iridovirus CN01]ASZ85106.1 126L [Cherax quadricarinatus iridovirus]ATE87039.1 group I intron endonuclease [Shrimp hemocyte iridescent virus]UPA43509.1 group I intron endonuclease [Iridovirus CN01]UPA43705.1 group I intron endonuclease [Iridovirus CN01]